MAPSVCWVSFGFSVMPPKCSSHVNVRNASLVYEPNAPPRKSFVPDFVMTVTAAPPVMPCSASKLLVEMLTSSMLSTGGTYTAW